MKPYGKNGNVKSINRRRAKPMKLLETLALYMQNHVNKVYINDIKFSSR